MDVAQTAITALCRHLALEIVRDGEGMARVMEVRVTGARDRDEASRVATAVAGSSLVKTALAGGDPNWGRILAAAANADVELDAESLGLALGGVEVFAAGQPIATDVRALQRAFAADEVRVDLSLGAGDGAARRLTTDLTEDYVRINSEYTT